MVKQFECKLEDPDGGPQCNDCVQWDKGKSTCRKGLWPHGADQQRCEIFHCDERRDRYCCYWCWRRSVCKNPCKNNPERCGAAFKKGVEQCSRSHQ